MNFIVSADQALFSFINKHGTPWLDPLMKLISSERFWLQIAIVLTVLVVARRQPRAWGIWILALIAVGVSDVLTYQVMKEWFQRPRPCYQQDVARLMVACGGRYGFPSNHAANGMAVAAVIMLAYRARWTFLVAALAFLVGFSRVYLGVHYPLDITIGFIEGALIGSFLFWLAKTLVAKAHHVVRPRSFRTP